jgi:hypothetical protein
MTLLAAFVLLFGVHAWKTLQKVERPTGLLFVERGIERTIDLRK